MAQAPIFEPGPTAAPVVYTIPGVPAVTPIACEAEYDGSGAAGDFLPTLIFRSQAGHVIARCPVDTAVVAGASAEVSWFPWRRLKAAPAPTTYALAVRCIAPNSGGNASFVSVNLGASFSDLWLHADVAFSQSFLNEEIANFDTQPIMATWAGASQRDDVDVSAGNGPPPYLTWNQHSLTSLFGPVVADTWYTLDFRTHIVGTNTQFELWVNGVSVGAIPKHVGVHVPVNIVTWGFATGNFSAFSGFDATMWARNCKVGTTMGAGDLFTDGGYAAGTIEPPFTDAAGFPALVPEPFILGRGPDLWP